MTVAETTTEQPRRVELVQPGTFDLQRHFYPRVLNAHIHPLVRYFMDLGNERIAERYLHLHPETTRQAVHAALEERMRFFRWGGADLFHVTNEHGERSMVVIETNSCPSGNKSMPRLVEKEEQSGYKNLIEHAVMPLLRGRALPRGELAVLYDKNAMETSGYAAVLADAAQAPVFHAPMFADDPCPVARCRDDGVIEVLADGVEWVPVRAALRYVTQRPWMRIPPITRSLVFNPVLVCLAGGRNKMLAAKAYDHYNAELFQHGLAIRTPETFWDVAKAEIPMWVQRMGGVAVVKVPYSNAGQGVFTITSKDELEAFMDGPDDYDCYVVQALIGNVGWSSRSGKSRMYHVGTVPNRDSSIFAADLRFMVGNGPDGFFPVAVYARSARSPLVDRLGEASPRSWDMLGTNLSVKLDGDHWTTETERLMLMDSRDFNRLGLGLDDLTEAYLQTVLAVAAIDRMAAALVTQKGRFRRRLFAALNPDPKLLGEILDVERGQGAPSIP